MKTPYIQQIKTVLFSSYLIASASSAHQITQDDSTAIESPKIQIQVLRDLVKNQQEIRVEDIAKTFKFSFIPGNCQETFYHHNYCNYTITQQHSLISRILVLAVGKDKKFKKNGGRIIWSLWNKDLCISEAEVEEILGKGRLKGLNIAELPPGIETPPPVYEDITYPEIPGITKEQFFAVSYKNKCAVQIQVIF